MLLVCRWKSVALAKVTSLSSLAHKGSKTPQQPRRQNQKDGENRLHTQESIYLAASAAFNPPYPVTLKTGLNAGSCHKFTFHLYNLCIHTTQSFHKFLKRFKYLYHVWIFLFHIYFVSSCLVFSLVDVVAVNTKSILPLCYLCFHY